jgi:hypothetical protein
MRIAHTVTLWNVILGTQIYQLFTRFLWNGANLLEASDINDFFLLLKNCLAIVLVYGRLIIYSSLTLVSQNQQKSLKLHKGQEEKFLDNHSSEEII